MRRLFLSLLGVIVLIASVNAGKVTEQQALQKAQQFMKGKSLVALKLDKALTRSDASDGIPAFYIFNAKEGEGFVIVSADDRTEAVLGYSYNGRIDIDNMPENLRWWLHGYAEQIKSLPADYQPLSPRSTRTSREAIPVLLATKWNQSPPYNLMCPEIDGWRCPTGCVATAVAQVMYYYQSPASCPAIPAFMNLERLPATTFKWDKMKTEYSWDETGESADAVAELMRYCGQSNGMIYSKESSSAAIQNRLMIKYFGYSKNMRRLFRYDYSDAHWESIIYDELAQSHPVFYDGSADPESARESGHQFICDGYDGNGKYHMNWGWGGFCDGFYLLSACNPESDGEPTGDRYNTSQTAIIGFVPAVEGEVEIPEMIGGNNYFESHTYTRASVEDNFEDVQLSSWIWTAYNVEPTTTFSTEIGWGIYRDETLLMACSSGNVTFEAQDYAVKKNARTVSFGKNLSDGEYQIRQIYKDPRTNDWELCTRYMSEGLVAEINGGSLYVRVIDTGKIRFSVDNMTYSDSPMACNPVDVQALVTNEGESGEVIACLWSKKEGDGKWQIVSTASASIKNGSTADMEFSFVPPEAAHYELKITSNFSDKALATTTMMVSTAESVVIDGVTYACSSTYQKSRIVSANSQTLPEILVIPSIVKNSEGVECQVIGIATEAFRSKGPIKKVVIPEGMVSINKKAFYNCYSLQEVELPSSLKSIGNEAFEYCDNLSVIVSHIDSPFEIGEGTFALKKSYNSSTGEYSYTPSKATLYVPVGSLSAYQQFKGWTMFANYEEGIPFETVQDQLRYSCAPGSKTATVVSGVSQWLEEVVIPASITVDDVVYKVKSVGTNAFNFNLYLKSVTLPEGIESIGNYAFNRTKLSELTLPKTLKSIGRDAFFYIPATSVVIPEGVVSVGAYSFAHCTNLERLELPSTLTYIGNNVIDGCDNLVTVISRLKSPIEINDYTFMTERYDESTQQWSYEPSGATLYVSGGSIEAYQKIKGWTMFKEIVEMASESIKISSAKQVTYMSDKDLDFSGYTDLKAYVATGYDKASGTIWLTRVKEVPAMTGFLLMGNAGTYRIPIMDNGSTSYYMNMFKGTIDGTTIQTTEGSNTNYYLSNGDAGVGFYKVQSSVELKPNRAYLSVPTEIPTVGAAGSTETIKVSAAGQVPYYNSASLDFSSLDAQGVKAYTATGYDYSSGTIWLTRVKQVPAETGILIMAPQGEYPVPTASVASVYANMFKGTLTGTTIQTHETIADEDYINYYLSSGDAGVGFYKVTKEGGVTIGANRCYLPIKNKEVAGTRSASSGQTQIAFEEADEVIGIQLMRGIGDDSGETTNLTPALSKGEGEWYTLQGQRVAKPGKGLYIRNGKKVVIK